MSKRGQFQISFGMIFSIFIIIAIIAVAGYVIYKVFIPTASCIETGLFHEPLEDHIDKAWQSTIHSSIFKGSLPAGIEQVCFGDIRQASSQYSEISRDFINSNGNVFLYPPHKACESSLASKKLEHVKINGFFCIQVKEGEIQIKTSKDQFEALVNIQPV